MSPQWPKPDKSIFEPPDEPSLEYAPKGTCAELAAIKQRLADIDLKDRGKTNEINILTKENRELQQRLADAEEIIRKVIIADMTLNEDVLISLSEVKRLAEDFIGIQPSEYVTVEEKP